MNIFTISEMDPVWFEHTTFILWVCCSNQLSYRSLYLDSEWFEHSTSTLSRFCSTLELQVYLKLTDVDLNHSFLSLTTWPSVLFTASQRNRKTLCDTRLWLKKLFIVAITTLYVLYANLRHIIHLKKSNLIF